MIGLSVLYIIPENANKVCDVSSRQAFKTRYLLFGSLRKTFGIFGLCCLYSYTIRIDQIGTIES